MAPILVTGGTGTLGRVLVADLIEAHSAVRVLSRRARRSSEVSACDWAQGDLRRGLGLDQALAGVEVIVHCATGRGDVAAARNLIDAARTRGVGHVVYISIVGVDRVPLGYYRSKLEVERLLEASRVPLTVLRTTQFHDLIARGCRALSRLPVVVVPAATAFQPISVDEVAGRLAELAQGPPAGRVADMGGPEVLGAVDLARAYLRATGRHRPVVAVRFPGKAAAGYRAGGHLCPDRTVGRQSFGDYLDSLGGATPARDRSGR